MVHNYVEIAFISKLNFDALSFITLKYIQYINYTKYIRSYYLDYN